MSIKMSDISKVLGLPQTTRKPSTLKKLRDPPAPRYIDKQRAIAIARQLKLSQIGKVSLRVSDRTGLSEIHTTSEKVLSRRLIIDQTKGLQTASVTKDSAVGKCILGPNKYHNRRLVNKVDKIVEDQEKKKSMLSRKTREFKHQRRKATSDSNDSKKQMTTPNIKLPSINTPEDPEDPVDGRRSKSPGYMRPKSCSGTRYTDTAVAEAEQFLNSNVIRATLDAPDNKSTVRALDLVEASNTEYRPKSASQIADDNSDSKKQGGEGDDSGSGDVPLVPEQSPTNMTKKRASKPLTPPAKAFASAGVSLLQNKYIQVARHVTPLTETSNTDLPGGDETLSPLGEDKQSKPDSESAGMKGHAEVSVSNETSTLAPGNRWKTHGDGDSSEEINTKFENQTDNDTNTVSNSGEGSESSINQQTGKSRLSKLKYPMGSINKKKPGFMETILDESPRSSPGGKKSPNLQGIILNPMSTLTVINDNDADHSANEGRSTPNGSSVSNMRRAATIAAQMIQLKHTSRRSRRRKNVAFSKNVRDTLAHNQPEYKVTTDPRFLNLQSSLIPDSANARHLYDAMNNISITDKPINKQHHGTGNTSTTVYSRKSENLAKFEDLFGKGS